MDSIKVLEIFKDIKVVETTPADDAENVIASNPINIRKNIPIMVNKKNIRILSCRFNISDVFRFLDCLDFCFFMKPLL